MLSIIRNDVAGQMRFNETNIHIKAKHMEISDE